MFHMVPAHGALYLHFFGCSAYSGCVCISLFCFCMISTYYLFLVYFKKNGSNFFFYFFFSPVATGTGTR